MAVFLCRFIWRKVEGKSSKFPGVYFFLRRRKKADALPAHAARRAQLSPNSVTH